MLLGEMLSECRSTLDAGHMLAKLINTGVKKPTLSRNAQTDIRSDNQPNVSLSCDGHETKDHQILLHIPRRRIDKAYAPYYARRLQKTRGVKGWDDLLYVHVRL